MDSTASIMLMFNENLLYDISLLHNPKDISLSGGNFGAHQAGLLTIALHHLPLPKKGYYFHCDAMANIISMVRVSDPPYCYEH